MLLERESYTCVGGWWDRKGENEIDLVAEDELKRRLDFYEIKRDSRDISLPRLEAKAKAYFEKNGGLKSNWVIRHQALSLKDM